MSLDAAPDQDTSSRTTSPLRARGFDRLLAPPRHVAVPVRCQMLFGGFLNQFGWFFFGFGMIFVWVFPGNADFGGLFRFGPTKTADGVVTNCEDAHASENHSKIYRVSYMFRGPREKMYEGKSYSVGSSPGSGTPVTVEYSDNDPNDSVIQGMRRKMFPPFVLFVLIFPIIGFCFLFTGYRRGKRANYLLKNGIIGEGAMISREPTNTRINNQMVYKFTFEFDAVDGRKHQIEARTHLVSKLEDDPKELLLYDPVDPDNAVVIDSLPAGFRADESGAVQPENSRSALLSMIVPTITMLGHGAYVVHAFL